jgi:DNA-binding NtrC family response regulator
MTFMVRGPSVNFTSQQKSHGEKENPMARDRVLVVDDETDVCELLSEILTRVGFQVLTASDGSTALEMAKNDGCSVAIVDLSLPDLPGMKTIQHLKEIDSAIEVIVYTGYPSLESSLDAIQKQVFDYICKPSDIRTLQRAVQRAAERRQLVNANQELMRQLETERNRLKQEVTAAKRVIERRLEDSRLLVGKTEEIKQIRHFVAQVAPSDITVLILGESGTGKEVVARLIPESSGRDPNAFVKINCPAIPETLLESELFGHESGAFTGAERRKPGRFELASGGTILLDEIGDLPLTLQGKLLQAIEQRHFTRLGGNKTIEVDVRIIAATNAPIEKMVAEGRFRADVFYRLNEYSIEMPPLRRRREDIPLLAQHFLKLYGRKYGNDDLKISPGTMKFITQHQWPGNVRELESAIRRIALEGHENSVLESLNASEARTAPSAVADVVRDTEIQTILDALSQTRWNRRKAAQLLGMSYSSLRRRIDKYGLKDQ